ncbi:MAG: hypothetical protein ABIQ16_09260 [Polyangiaceae bacterium]
MTERLCPPSASTLLDELTGDLGSERGRSGEPQRFAIAELNQRLSDVSFALGLLPSTFTALIRISLASGSALALLGFTEVGSGRLPLDTALRAGLCAVSGLVGAGVVAAIGRSAKRRSSELRLEWDRVSRELGKQLGTSLEQASHVAEREPRQK